MTPRILNAPSPANIALIDNGAIPMISRMMQNGIAVNRDALSDLSRTLAADCLRIEQEIADCVGERVSPSSPPQVAALLFRTLKIQHLPNAPSRKMKYTAGGTEATGKLEIEPYLGVHPVVRMILQHRERDKLKGTYADAMWQHARQDCNGVWRVHTTIKPYSTDTGRLASESPNLQNIPVRSKLGRLIKACFIASPHKRLIEVDFSQIEMRMAAHLADASFMCAAFRANQDIHVKTAVRVFKLPESQIHEQLHRYPCKRVGFGVLYKITGAGLVRQLNAEDSQDPDNPKAWTEEECDALIESWYAENPEILDLQNEIAAQAYRYGYIWDLYGRIRAVPEVRSCHREIRNKGIRQACNMPIQSGAQGLIKIAMGQLTPMYDELRAATGVEELMQIHDALLLEADEDYAEDVARLTQDVMENVAVLRIPIKADSKVGRRQEDGWSNLQKLKAA